MEENLTIFFCIFLVIPVIAGVIYVKRKKKIERFKNMPLKITDDFTYTAHTGCLNTKANSLESIDVGFRNGATIIEFDLNFNKENEPVLAHDEPKGGEVTLDEAFKRVSRYEDLCVNVDVKKCSDLALVEMLAKKYDIIKRIFFTGIEKKDTEIVKKSCPNVDYYLNVAVAKPNKQTDEYLESLVKEIKACGAVGINFNKDNATDRLVEVFHKNGLLVSIWTVNDEKEIYRILSYGPDNITTKRPDLLKACVEEVRNKE